MTHALRLGFDLSASNTSTRQDGESALLDLLRRSGPVLVALVQCTPTDLYDDMCDLLLRAFRKPSSMQMLIEAVVEFEVETTLDEGLLFRGNSLTTRLLTTYAKQEGSPWLEVVLEELKTSFRDVIVGLVSLPESSSASHIS